MALAGPSPELVFVMVGLPARGKTHLARHMVRYLKWHGYSARVFNVGNYRRARLGAQQPHTFFDASNVEAVEARQQMARAALDDLLLWMEHGGQVAIYDATNVTRERRAWVRDAVEVTGRQVVFVESICHDENIVRANIRETKLRSPDYKGADPAEAVADFRARIAHYAAVYEPLSDDEGAYLQLIDVGRKVVLHDLRGHLVTRLTALLLNLHIDRRPIFLTRHGESEWNAQGRIGGDPDLTPRGREYAVALSAWLAQQVRPGQVPVVWTSTLRRALATAAPLLFPHAAWKVLDEIHAGVCDGMTYGEIADTFPDVARERSNDKLRFRYPQGESYADVIQRLDPVILELERQRDPVLVVAHNAVIRCLYAYLTSRPAEQAPHLDIPLHTVVKLTPSAYGCDEERIPLL